MAATVDYDIVGSYNNQRVKSIDAERSINLFEYIDPLGKKQKSLLSTSGIKTTGLEFAQSGAGFRQSFYFNGNTYHVVEDDVYLVKQVGNTLVPTLLNGSLPLTTSVGYVGIEANTFQVIFVDGVHGYIYDTNTGSFVQITDAAFPTQPIDVTYLDEFFIVADGNTPNFYMSSLDQGLVWGGGNSSDAFTLGAASSNVTLTTGSTVNYQVGTPLDITGSTVAEIPDGKYFVVQVVSPTVIRISATIGGSAITSAAGGGGTLTNNGILQEGQITSHPGTLVACRTLHRRVFFFSQFYTEVWENQGLGTSLPIRRNNSLLIEYGTVALGSVSVAFDKMIFIGQAKDGLGPVMEVGGVQAVPISTKALDFQLAAYNSTVGISDCRGFFLKENGLIFYRMNFTAADHTFIYNVSQSNPSSEQTKYWHEEEMLDGSRHVAQTHVYYNGVNYVGDYANPILYVISSLYTTNDGERIHRTRISKAFVPPGYQRLRIDRLQVDLLQGQNYDLIFDNVPITTENGVDLLTEVGNTLITDQTFPINQDIDPVIYLSISKDGGQTYGNQLAAPLGDVGERTFRTLWRKLGTTIRGQAFVTKLEYFEEAPLDVLGACWAFEVLPE